MSRIQSQAVEFSESSVVCASPSGLHRMVYSEWGERHNPEVLVCVHGLARNGRDFDELARSLAARYRVVCPDVAGRGRSDWLADPVEYGILQYVSDMMVLVARLDVPSVNWLGTSMGGLIGMILAGFDGSPVKRLILNDVGPVIDPVSIRRIGEYIGRSPVFDSLEDAEIYVRRVSAPFGTLSDVHWRHLTQTSLRQRRDGRLEFNYDPAIAASFRRATSAGEIDLWSYYDRVRCPVLALRGAESDLLSPETLAAMSRRGPRSEVMEVPGVGHAPMFLDEKQISIVRDYLDAGTPGSGCIACRAQAADSGRQGL
jgi:pimeloyl-ACP methyl ester carboxylesterase